MTELDKILAKLAELIQTSRFEELETDALEIKPVPAIGGEWRERHKSVNAFLNTRGGILVLGVKEEQKGDLKRYVFTGWQPHAEPKIKEFSSLFTDRQKNPQLLTERFPPPQVRPFLDGRIAIVYVDELPADKKFVFYEGSAYKRIVTGDQRISDPELDAQEEFKTEAIHARELQPVPNLAVSNLDLTKLNNFIYQLNQPVQVETIKPDITSAVPFLERRCFLKDGAVTVLGALVCAEHPGDVLGFRSHVDGYVDIEPTDDDVSRVVQDKQDFIDNVLQLMESTFGYILRNIQLGVSSRHGGSIQFQYPQALLRETVNNALAHRDYAIDRQVIVAIKPGKYISIQNPGNFRRQLLIEFPDHEIPLRRILPEAKPRNPKLADVLRVYRKWEGRGIGMATLVNLCLQNQIGLPYYRLLSEEVRLYLQAGKLLDERMERLFESFNGYIQTRLDGNSLTEEQKLVLSYLIKSEWANRRDVGYTILLTPDNNHFNALRTLETAALVFKHPHSSAIYPIYNVDRVLMTVNYASKLRAVFGPGIDALDQLDKDILSVVFRFNHYSKQNSVSAKQTSFTLWYEEEKDSGDIKAFDAFYRKVRRAFNRLEKSGFVVKATQTRGYILNSEYLRTHLI